MTVFKSADILLPEGQSFEKWAVIACDQFTSQPEYWEKVREIAGDAPSAVNVIIPESELTDDNRAKAAAINKTMEEYLNAGIFKTYKDSYIYVERTLLDGSIRTGVVGAVDLEAYDYSADAKSAIRATEKTVVSRIPPRKQVRDGAPMELPHILILCDDPDKKLIESLTAKKDSLPVVYDFDTMMGGGHITGRLVSGADKAAFDAELDSYEARVNARGGSLLFGMGDGNHSLATAKACYEELKARDAAAAAVSPIRYALAELGNIHEDSLKFEGIHRIIVNCNPEELVEKIQKEACAPGGYEVKWYAGDKSGVFSLDPSKGSMAIVVLQNYLDEILPGTGCEIDYIHDDDATIALSKKPGTLSILLPAMEKSELFPGIEADGVLPRKTFSIGHAQEKRYYLEARLIG